MGSKRSKAALGVGTILTAIVYAAANLPEPFNWIFLVIAIIFGFVLILDVVGVF